ncbi:MAG: DUF1570 domain-containing protein [Phycisphaeraceae bacterium]
MGKTLSILVVVLLSAGAAWADGSARHERIREHFERSPRVYRSAHFVIVHDSEEDEAAARAKLLEQTYRRFAAAVRDAGLSAEGLERKLFCLLFAERSAFDRYALEVDQVDMSWSGGYYSSRTNRVALFDSGDWLPKIIAAGENEEAGGEAAMGQVASVDAAMSLAATTHEAAHQLAFNTGLQTRGVMYPLWASEGLATNFESERPGRPFGPAHLNQTRAGDFRQAWRAGRITPLRQFVGLTKVPTSEPMMINAVYAQAWSLFRYLYLEHPSQLGQYLREVADLPRGSRSAEQMRREFEDAFGSAAAVERGWLEHLREQEIIPE